MVIWESASWLLEEARPLLGQLGGRLSPPHPRPLLLAPLLPPAPDLPAWAEAAAAVVVGTAAAAVAGGASEPAFGGRAAKRSNFQRW